jgi:uncharacterized protein YkwD
MRSFRPTTSLLGVICSTLALAACSGGGGDGGGTSTTPPPPVVRENYAQVTYSPTTTYASSSNEAAAYLLLNTVRLGASAGALTQDAQLDTAAAKHLAYLKANDPYVGDNESPDKTGYTGATVADRAKLAGYLATEVLEMTGSVSGVNVTAKECVQSLLDAPYAANVLLRPWRDIGLAVAQVHTPASVQPPAAGASAPAADVPKLACVLVLGVKQSRSGQLPDTGQLKTYPYGNQSDVPFSFGPAPKGYNPAPDLETAQGTPIQASMQDFGSLTNSAFKVTRFTLTDMNGQVVPARLIVSSGTTVALNTTYFNDPTGALPASDVMLLPLSPLLADRIYTVNFEGSNGSTAYTKAWTFTTAATKP